MSERSIAEIIGWQLETESWPVVNHGGPVDKPFRSETRYYRVAPDGEEREPTVDDMLAWLLMQPPFVFDNKWYGPCTMWASKLGFIVTMTDADGDEVSSDCKPTLHEALEEIVRLVSAALEHPLDVGGDTSL